MTTKTEITLLPCPCCKAPARMSSEYENGDGEPAVECRGCNLLSWTVEDWNRRAADRQDHFRGVTKMVPSDETLPDLFREALSWGRAWGRTIPPQDWDELRDDQVAQLLSRYSSSQPAASAEPADPALPYEQALAELIDKIIPGLDTGDILADAKQASAALGLGAPVAQEPVVQDLTRGSMTEQCPHCGAGPYYYCAHSFRAAPVAAQDREDEEIGSAEATLLAKTLDELDDCGETTTDRRTLLRWAFLGLLECTHFIETDKGRTVAARAAKGAGDARLTHIPRG